MAWTDKHIQGVFQKEGLSLRVCIELERLRTLINSSFACQGNKQSSAVQLESVTEYEATLYYVAPLLKTLGWSEQHVKYELAGRDIVCYEPAFCVQYKRDGRIDWEATNMRNSLNARLLFEVKNPWNTRYINTKGPAVPTMRQLAGYANKLTNLRCAVVTNGLMYYIYNAVQLRESSWKPVLTLDVLGGFGNLQESIESIRLLKPV